MRDRPAAPQRGLVARGSRVCCSPSRVRVHGALLRMELRGRRGAAAARLSRRASTRLRASRRGLIAPARRRGRWPAPRAAATSPIAPLTTAAAGAARRRRARRARAPRGARRSTRRGRRRRARRSAVRRDRAPEPRADLARVRRGERAHEREELLDGRLGDARARALEAEAAALGRRRAYGSMPGRSRRRARSAGTSSASAKRAACTLSTPRSLPTAASGSRGRFGGGSARGPPPGSVGGRGRGRPPRARRDELGPRVARSCQSCRVISSSARPRVGWPSISRSTSPSRATPASGERGLLSEHDDARAAVLQREAERARRTAAAPWRAAPRPLARARARIASSSGGASSGCCGRAGARAARSARRAGSARRAPAAGRRRPRRRDARRRRRAAGGQRVGGDVGAARRVHQLGDRVDLRERESAGVNGLSFIPERRRPRERAAMSADVELFDRLEALLERAVVPRGGRARARARARARPPRPAARARARVGERDAACACARARARSRRRRPRRARRRRRRPLGGVDRVLDARPPRPRCPPSAP